MNERATRAEYLPIEKLHAFENHPFQVRDDDQMEQLVWSILSQGVMTPVIVRPMGNEEYEVISGHRRVHACQKAGIAEIPALIYDLDRDAAAIALVDSNLHREDLRKYFPPGYPEEKIRQDITKALELLLRQRQRSRDAR